MLALVLVLLVRESTSGFL